MRCRWGVAAAVVALLVSGLLLPSARAAGADLTFVDAAGIHVESVTQLDARQYNVKVSTAALGRAVDVRVLVPADYATTTDRLPVLYLFHGTSGRASDWVQSGDAEAATDGLPLVLVMPDAGFDGNGGGWFTNWVDTTTKLGPSQWEMFHVDQLIPWVDANLRTRSTRDGRAVAGLSQGGFGSTTYAARHPDLFASVASFSGAPDIDYNPVTAAGATAIIEATAVGLDGVEPEAMFGSRATNEINWQGHDPADLVNNLRGVDVWLYTATGADGPYDPSPNPGASGIELATHGSTISFVQRAQDQGVPVHLEDYVYGTHTWAYWARDLRQYLVPLMKTFVTPVPAPASVSYQSIDTTWSQWGWDVTIDRGATQQFSALTAASSSGFTLQGSGTATVTTPPVYVPGSVHTVATSGPLGSTTSAATADAVGRLKVIVSLGPALPTVAVVGVPTLPPARATVRIAA
ncbi:MAG TPA: alpha/beta hydrolase family protein [Acidimicrobiales bacterium]|nr:alpha/beta hydrolase family protein [Acidimicrobiales bacterium]